MNDSHRLRRWPFAWNVAHRETSNDFEGFEIMPISTKLTTDGSLYEAFHVDVTPTTFHLDGLFIEQSNRVIRAYDRKHEDCFLRVSFVDEAHLQYRFDHEIDGREFTRSRIGPLLYNGLKVARRKFDFLACSQSALREHAVW
jgi:RNA-dependent RNA polymerase